MTTTPQEPRVPEGQPEDLPEAGDPTRRPPEEHLDPTNPESAAMAPGEPGDGDEEDEVLRDTRGRDSEV